MKKTLLASGFLLITLLTGCASMMKISNVGIPNSTRNAAMKTVGKNSALSYIANGSIDEACAIQTKILQEASWSEADALENKGTYLKATYTNGKEEMILVCSQTEISETEKATKVTLTLMTN